MTDWSELVQIGLLVAGNDSEGLLRASAGQFRKSVITLWESMRSLPPPRKGPDSRS